MGDGAGSLSGRQMEALGHLMEGISNKEIARRMDITEGTVKLHLQAVFDKIGVRKRAKAVLWLFQSEVAVSFNPKENSNGSTS